MSAGSRIEGGAIDIVESAADVAPVGTTRLVRKGGRLLLSSDASAFSPLGSSDVWFDTETRALAALLPASTLRFEYVKAGQSPNGAAKAAQAVDAPIVGGGMGVASDTLYLPFSSTVWQTPRTDVWAVSFRCKFPAISGTALSVVGIATTAPSNVCIFGWNQPTSATKWVLVPSGGSIVTSTFNADALVHTVRLFSDGTTITAQVDGVTVATSAQVSTLTNSPCGPASFSNLAITPGVLVSRITYGYVDPS